MGTEFTGFVVQGNINIADTFTGANANIRITPKGLGDIALNGNTQLQAGKGLYYATGSGIFDMANSTGTFATGTGDIALSGNTQISSGKKLTLGSALVMGATGGGSRVAFENTTAGSSTAFVSGDLNSTGSITTTGTVTASTLEVGSAAQRLKLGTTTTIRTGFGNNQSGSGNPNTAFVTGTLDSDGAIISSNIGSSFPLKSYTAVVAGATSGQILWDWTAKTGGIYRITLTYLNNATIASATGNNPVLTLVQYHVLKTQNTISFSLTTLVGGATSYFDVSSNNIIKNSTLVAGAYAHIVEERLA